MARAKNYKAIVPRGNPDKVLTEQEHSYVQHRAKGLNKAASARLAGYAGAKDVGADLERRPHVLAALTREQAAYAEQSKVTRQEVIDGIKEAIDQAKLAGEPMTQIAGWRELAKICGYYAPEVKKMELSGDAQKLLKRFEDMSDRDLLELASASVTLEGEYTTVAS